MPDFLTTLYATVAAITTGDIDEAEISYCHGEGEPVLTVTVRRMSTVQVIESPE